MAVNRIEHKAPKKAHLTLTEVEAFVRQARAAGATGAEAVLAGVNWGGNLNRLGIELEMATDGVVLDMP